MSTKDDRLIVCSKKLTGTNFVAIQILEFNDLLGFFVRLCTHPASLYSKFQNRKHFFNGRVFRQHYFSLFLPARRTVSDTLECRKESKANVSHCDCGEKENRQKKKYEAFSWIFGRSVWKNTTAQQYLSSNRSSQNVLGGLGVGWYQTDEAAFNFLWGGPGNKVWLMVISREELKHIISVM